MLQQATSTITCGQNSFSWFPSNESWAERIKCVADFCWKERRISFGLGAGFVLKREQVYFVRYFKPLPHPLTLYGATSFNRQQTRTKSAPTQQPSHNFTLRSVANFMFRGAKKSDIIKKDKNNTIQKWAHPWHSCTVWMVLSALIVSVLVRKYWQHFRTNWPWCLVLVFAPSIPGKGGTIHSKVKT